MKKLTIATLALVTLLGLTGCSDAYTNVSDKNAALFTVNGNAVTKGDLYPMLMYYGGVNTSLDLVMQHIMDIEVPMDETAIEEAKADFEALKENMGEIFKTLINYYGFETEEEFYEKSFLPEQQNIRLVAKYVDAKFDTLAVTQKPRKVQIMEFEDMDIAKEAYDRVFNKQESFEEVAKELATDTFDGSELVVTSASKLDSKLLTIITETTVNKRIDEIVEGNNKKFYVANVIEGDPEKFREEACDAIAASSTVSKDANRYFLQQYEFKISDKFLHDLYKDNNADYIFD